jgi:hypothetical protein
MSSQRLRRISWKKGYLRWFSKNGQKQTQAGLEWSITNRGNRKSNGTGVNWSGRGQHWRVVPDVGTEVGQGRLAGRL